MDNKMSRSKIFVLVVVFYIIIYVLLKLFIVYTQDLYMKNEVYDKEYGIGNVLNITKYTNEEKNNTAYFSNKSNNYSIKVKSYFDDFEVGDSDYNYEYYMLYDDDNHVEAAFMMGMFDTQIENINGNVEDSIYYEFDYWPLYISNYLRKMFLKKHNIKNDIDLIKYIRKREKIKCNFFTSIYKIKENYFFNFIETSYPPLDNITYIEGDINGYIYQVDDYKQACIIKNNKLYCLTFYKLNYFTDDIIEDVLRSVIIEK